MNVVTKTKIPRLAENSIKSAFPIIDKSKSYYQ